MLSKSLITLYINICKITKLILVTQHTYNYANIYIYIYICKLNAIGIRTHSINMHIYVVQVTYNIIHKYM